MVILALCNAPLSRNFDYPTGFRGILRNVQHNYLQREHAMASTGYA